MLSRIVAVFAVVMNMTGGIAAGPDDPVALNTCRLAVSGSDGAPALDLEVTYISESLMPVLFGSEETRTKVRAAAGGRQAFLVRASARRATDFYPTSFSFAQGKEKLDPSRSGLVPLDGSFGGRLASGESTRGLLVIPAKLDLTGPVTIEYASSSQSFRFASAEPLQGAVKAEGVKVDRVQALEWKVQDLERRLQAIEERVRQP